MKFTVMISAASGAQFVKVAWTRTVPQAAPAVIRSVASAGVAAMAAKRNLALERDALQLENVLGQVEADHDNLFHGWRSPAQSSTASTHVASPRSTASPGFKGDRVGHAAKGSSATTPLRCMLREF